ncbi:hypothetical protein ACFLRW_03965 [Acidobacteriota bacterium]
MNRREFLLLVGSAALASPAGVLAQKLDRGEGFLDPHPLPAKFITPKKQIEILSPHYTWYTEKRWHSGPEFAFTEPLRGHYSSGNPDVVTAQNAEKESYGVGVDVVSWWGPGDLSYNLFKQGYLRAKNFENRPFCFLYEIFRRLPRTGHEVFDFKDPKNVRGFIEDIEYLEKNYFWYPNYYRINGKPVLYNWWNGLKNFDAVSQQIKDRVYLIGSIDILWPPNELETEKIHALSWFDAISQYGISPIYVAKEYGCISDEFIQKFTKTVLYWENIIKNYCPNLELILPIQYAYQDHRGWVDKKDGKNRTLNHDPIQSEKFTKVVRLLAEKLDCVKRTMLVSYNEHWEGHGAEPSFQYGDMWLALINRFFKKNEPFYMMSDLLQDPNRSRMYKNQDSWRIK